VTRKNQTANELCVFEEFLPHGLQAQFPGHIVECVSGEKQD